MTAFDPAAPHQSPRLTRELLLGNGLAEMIARGTPRVRVLTEAERHASLHALLAERPEHGSGIWLFAYGSLIWNPTIRIGERRVATARGWHRAFCLSTSVGRGTPENPGLLLGLREGGACMGAALRVDEADLEHELDVLWRREMVTGGYVPRWLAVEDAGGELFGHAIGFTSDPAGPSYIDGLAEDELIRRLATAQGELGTSAEYLFRTWHGLRAMGIADPLVDRLAPLVEAVLRKQTMTD
jgi:glutathione-specific gamma-glutamylcyclotransferase